MYSLPSTSHRSAPRPREKNSGSPPTALKARTGEFTPPGMTWRAFSNRLREMAPTGSAPEQARRLLGEVGDDQVGSGPADGGERFQHDAITVDPAIPRRRLDHGVFAGDVVRGDRNIDLPPHATDDVQVRQGGLHT